MCAVTLIGRSNLQAQLRRPKLNSEDLRSGGRNIQGWLVVLGEGPLLLFALMYRQGHFLMVLKSIFGAEVDFLCCRRLFHASIFCAEVDLYRFGATYTWIPGDPGSYIENHATDVCSAPR